MQLVGTATVTVQEGVQTFSQSNDLGPAVDTTMPAGLFELRFAEPDSSRGFWRLYLAGKRIRAHVSFECVTGVPMVYLLEGPGLLFPFKQFGDLDRVIAYRGPADESQVGAWRAGVEAAYERARSNLRCLSPDDDLDRAICLVGEALVQEDIEESFSCLWRAIERVAKKDLRKVRTAVQTGDTSAAAPYAQQLAKGLINSQPVTLEIDTAVEVTVAARASAYAGPRVSELYGLRTAIIHDNPTPDQMKRIAETRPDLLGLAYQVVRSALTEVPGARLPPPEADKSHT